MKSVWKFLGTLVLLWLAGLALWSPGSQAEATSEQTTPSMEDAFVEVSEPVVPHLSIAARDLPRIEQLPRLDREINPLRNPHHLSPDLGMKGSDTKGIDPLFESSRLGVGQTPDPLLNFEGLGSDGFTPPDTVGDVGPNHYVQMVNVSFQMYDKSGNVVLADTPFNALFTGAGGQCESNNDGDPIVIYDDMADRWMLSQFADIFGTMTMCIAVSQTPDPTGAYYLYEFNGLPAVPDYMKYGAWPDGYYMSTNSGSPNAYYAHVFDRVNMLAGAPATRQSFGGYPNFMMPADADGTLPPPAGAPNYFYTFLAEGYANHPPGVDRLVLYEFDVDWSNPGNSTFAAVQEIPIADFNYTVCGFFVQNCIPQPGTAQTIDSLSYWPMFRFQYRNFGAYEAMVGNFTVDLDGTDKAAIRWFELRKEGAPSASPGGGDWTLYQEGTHAPDDDHRWMGSVAMDGSGNMALGYSVSSSSTFPSIRYATRLRTDPLGTLQDEATLIDGGGSQTGAVRWGDYSAMTVDPTDQCTFWYTTEYHPSNDAGFNWHTRIGTFTLPECTGGIEPDFTLTVEPTSQAVCAPNNATYDIAIGSIEGFNEPVDLSVVGAPAGTTTSFSVDPVTPSDPPAMSVLTIGNTNAAGAGSYSFDVVGNATSSTHAKTVELEIFLGVPNAPTLVSPSNGATGVDVMPTFEWFDVADTTEYLLEVATDAGFTNIVYSATETGTSHVPASALNYETEYYWRVTAMNGCGGTASAAFSFTTADTPIVMCSTPHLSIPDNDPTGASDTLNNPNTGSILDVDISIGATHTWVGDLAFTVEHNGTSVTIYDRPGVPASTFGCSGDDIDAILDDEAGTSVEDECGGGTPSIQGSFIPNEALSAFNGMELSGDWTITVSDNAGGDTGILNEWCVIPTFTGGGDTTVQVGSGSVAPGGSIEIPLEALDVPAPGVAAATIDVTYDPSVVTVTSCDADPNALFDTSQCNINFAPDTIRFTAISTGGVSGHLALADITFEGSPGSAGDSSPLEVTVDTFSDPGGGSIPAIGQNGLLEIGNPGDVTCDGASNAVDALFILQHVVGTRDAADTCPLPPETLYEPGCDVSGEGTCNTVDALFVLQCVVGIPNSFCPSGNLIPSSSQAIDPLWLNLDSPTLSPDG